MDILIKNIEMPKDNKRIFLCIEKDGEVGVFEEKKLIRFTEAHELPPHGRLIDADKLLKEENKTYVDTGYWATDYEAIKIKVINTAPTIVEASNGTDN